MTYTVLQTTHKGNNNTYYCAVDDTMHGTTWHSEISIIFTGKYHKVDCTSIDSWIATLKANNYLTVILATTYDIASLPQSHPELFL